MKNKDSKSRSSSPSSKNTSQTPPLSVSPSKTPNKAKLNQTQYRMNPSILPPNILQYKKNLYEFLQAHREFVNDVVDCMNEKVPQIEQCEEKFFGVVLKETGKKQDDFRDNELKRRFEIIERLRDDDKSNSNNDDQINELLEVDDDWYQNEDEQIMKQQQQINLINNNEVFKAVELIVANHIKQLSTFPQAQITAENFIQGFPLQSKQIDLSKKYLKKQNNNKEIQDEFYSGFKMGLGFKKKEDYRSNMDKDDDDDDLDWKKNKEQKDDEEQDDDYNGQKNLINEFNKASQLMKDLFSDVKEEFVSIKSICDPFFQFMRRFPAEFSESGSEEQFISLLAPFARKEIIEKKWNVFDYPKFTDYFDWIKQLKEIADIEQNENEQEMIGNKQVIIIDDDENENQKISINDKTGDKKQDNNIIGINRDNSQSLEMAHRSIIEIVSKIVAPVACEMILHQYDPISDQNTNAILAFHSEINNLMINRSKNEDKESILAWNPSFSFHAVLALKMIFSIVPNIWFADAENSAIFAPLYVFLCKFKILTASLGSSCQTLLEETDQLLSITRRSLQG
ncbi:MAG: hypothetical protein EZS28_004364 [Streblomastix strix]|uniref:GCF C-terminal domain-containing protein n=1 Tax=Streblomastix strix TaxID=222440 RepID=A0A5J4X0J1_9EUKA|nr:MAG: hypothetical protein EZS28_004364 [Streblomastix strix]